MQLVLADVGVNFPSRPFKSVRLRPHVQFTSMIRTLRFPVWTSVSIGGYPAIQADSKPSCFRRDEIFFRHCCCAVIYQLSHLLYCAPPRGALQTLHRPPPPEGKESPNTGKGQGCKWRNKVVLAGAYRRPVRCREFLFDKLLSQVDVRVTTRAYLF